LSYALITGAAKRIGKALAISLADKGLNIILHYNTSVDEAKSLQKIIINLGRKCILLRNDFASLSFNLDTFKMPISVLINNASVFENDYLDKIEMKNLLHTLNINFTYPAILTKLVLKNSSYKGQINVINILDTIIYKLLKNFSTYYLSKKSLADFTRLSALFYAPDARVNGISLGQIMKNDNQSQENFNKSVKNNPLGHSGTVEEICNTVDFLINTRSITGQIISLDGGSHLNNFTYP